MLDPTVFRNQFTILEERWHRTFSQATFSAYFEALADKLTTEEFLKAAKQVFAEDEFFPSPKRLIELGQLSRPQPLFLPSAKDKSFEELSPEEQAARRAAIAGFKQQLQKIKESNLRPGSIASTISTWIDDLEIDF